MTNTKTNKYAPLVMILKREFETRRNAAAEFKVKIRIFIISSLGAVPGDSVSTFKSLVEKCPMSNVNLWLKRIVCEVLKGSWMIWTRVREDVYNTMRPKVTLEKLEKINEKYAEEGSYEKQEYKDCINLRRVLQDVNRLKHVIVGETHFKDSTQALISPNFDSKAKLRKEEDIGKF
jgi:hypothetical protein